MKDSAKLLGLSKVTLYKLVMDDSIPSFCIGTRRLIMHEDLVKFCRDRVRDAASQISKT
jgi:excisionase family DNA binding protein